jgi:hypothetical protein
LKKIQKKQYDDDDGRTIVSMDVEGMPWYDRRHDFVPKSERGPSQPSPYGTGLTNRELRLYTWGALKAGLLVASVFAVTWILLVLFLTQVVFR